MGGSIKPGQKVSALVIREILSSGGMAVVVRASRPDGPDIAVKFSKPDKRDDPFFGQKLVGEVEILRDIWKKAKPAGIVRILPMTWERRPNLFSAEAFEISGEPQYYAMELLAGPSLDKYLRSLRSVSPQIATLIGAKVARTLGELHSLGYTHNDIKPDNIVFRHPISGSAPDKLEPVLIDFGVSVKHKSGFDGIAPPYAAPEKLEVACKEKPEEHVEDLAKTDVWSLGITLYQMLLGRLPYDGRDCKGVLTSIRRRQLETIRKRRRDVPPELEDVIIRLCLADKPKERPNARDLADSLHQYARQAGSTA